MPRSYTAQLDKRSIAGAIREVEEIQNRTEKSPVNKLRTVSATTQPTLTDGETILWWKSDSSAMYLNTRRGATYYKVQLT